MRYGSVRSSEALAGSVRLGKDHYENKGYRVLAPAYPGYEVEALRADPTPIAEITIPQIISHLESIIDGLDSQPILMGHSAGGAFTQILLDHGYGAVGVAINSAPTEGVKLLPLSQLRSTLPVFSNFSNRHKAVGFTHEQWHYAFTNTFSEEESRALYDRYHIPAAGSILWGSVLANLQPGHQDAWVDYHNDDRAPLLFIAGEKDHLMPPSVQRSNASHYRSNTITEVIEFPGRAHLLPAQEGWEEIADHALSWAVEHARPAAPVDAA